MRSMTRFARGAGAGLTVLAVMALSQSTVAAAVPAPRFEAAAAATHRAARTVTLLTGDRITVDVGDKVAVERGPGRAHATFLTQRVAGHLHVIPIEAMPLLREGRLDPRLFDVTTLLDFGYDRRPDLPLILRVDQASAAATRMAVTAPGARVVRDLPAVRGLAVRVGRDEAGALWSSLTVARSSRVGQPSAGAAAQRALRPGLATVWLDGLRQPTLDVSVPQVGAPTAWAEGFDGTGQRVAVLDTGVDVTHPDLVDRIDAVANFTEGNEDDRDLVGHGTHVASTIAGSGAASAGRYRGVAPGARLLDGKVCVQFGCAESWILAGMQWAADQGASVVNLSLGGPDTPGLDPVEQAVQTLTAERGTLFVVAAGNAGPDNGTVESPASADAALAVGAVSKMDELADFSSRGLRVGDRPLKPDLTAPGVDITAARGKDGFLGNEGESYTTISGTSMAAPHVAGAAAILKQRHPDWSPERLKAVLMGSATVIPSAPANGQGAGRLDVARAIDQIVVATPASVSFGRADWPHTDDPPIPVTVSYSNVGTAAVTLSLDVTATGPDGAPAPAGMFTVSPATVTVPAGGHTEVTLTADPRLGVLTGYASGRLTATGGAVVVRTPFAVDSEAESYDLTLAHTGRAGGSPGGFSTTILRTDEFAAYGVTDPVETLRLPRGRYLVVSVVTDGDPAHPDITLLVQPRLDLTRSQTVALDARVGRPIVVSVPNASATPILVDVTGLIHTAALTTDFSVLTDRTDGVYTAQVGPGRAVPEFTSRVHLTLGRVGPDQSFDDSPFAYLLTWYTEGRMVTGFRRSLARGQLAAVRADHAAQATDARGSKIAFADPADRDVSGWNVPMPFRLPFVRAEYYNTDGGIRWTRVFDEVPAAGGSSEPISHVIDPPTPLRAGLSSTERWNRAVFAPSLSDPPFADVWATRIGDALVFFPPIFADGAGRAGSVTTTSEGTVLFRNGTRIGEEACACGKFEVPPARGAYRVEMTAERGEPAILSTHIGLVWTFRSGHADGDDPVRLPLSVVRFTPPVDDRNVAPAGRTFHLPVAVVPQPGSSAGRNRSLVVDVSYDDGRTWRRARLGAHEVVLSHPRSAGFVSLRATAVDVDGNTVTVTIIRAYRIA